MTESDAHPQICVIARVGVRHFQSEKSQRDQRILNKRIKKCGEKFTSIPKMMEKIFQRELTFKDYRRITDELKLILDITTDRLSTRIKAGMICWFAENWDIINKYLPIIASKFKKDQRLALEKDFEFINVPLKSKSSINPLPIPLQ